MTRVSFVRAVYPVRYRTGDRFEIVLCGSRHEEAGIPYTWNALYASVCERASVVHRAVTMTTRETTFGEEVVAVDFVPEQSQEVA
jgi:hypothetical protein